MKKYDRKKEQGYAAEYNVFVEQPLPKVIGVIERFKPPIIDDQFQENKIERDIEYSQRKQADD